MHFAVDLDRLLGLAILRCFCCRSTSRSGDRLSRHRTHCWGGGARVTICPFLSLFYLPTSHIYMGTGVGEIVEGLF